MGRNELLKRIIINSEVLLTSAHR